MISLKFDSKMFKKEMDNIMEYSVGFVDGFVSGRKEFLNNLGPEVAELASQFIDTNARVAANLRAPDPKVLIASIESTLFSEMPAVAINILIDKPNTAAPIKTKGDITATVAIPNAYLKIDLLIFNIALNLYKLSTASPAPNISSLNDNPNV